MNATVSDGIDYKEIYKYAIIARAAYLSSAEIEGEYGSSQYVIELAGSQMQAALITDSERDIQWLTIRGTHNLKNVLVDGKIKVVHEPLLGIYIHGGFLHATKELYKSIEPELNPKREIRITGHSLGGAVALILTALLTEHSIGYRLGRTVTFGQPMVTDSNGVKKLKKYSLLRIVNHWDPVAILPLILSRTHFEFPPTIFYHHAGPQLTLYQNQKPKYSTPRKLIKFAFGYKRLIPNHFMDLYLQRLQRLTS